MDKRSKCGLDSCLQVRVASIFLLLGQKLPFLCARSACPLFAC
jgi:hypothetical protein